MTEKTPLTYSLLRGADAMSAAETAWRDLESRIPVHVFQRYDHARLWCEYVGGPERATPVIVIARSGETVVGIAPLCITYLGPLRLLTWLGGPRIMDYGDVLFDAVTAPVDATAFTREALLRAQRSAALAALYLPTVRTDATAYPYLESSLVECKRGEAPFVAAQPWEEFVAKRSRRHRHEVARYWRRLEEAGDCEVRAVAADDPAFETSFQRLVELHRSRHPGPGARSEFYDPHQIEMRRAQLIEMPGARLSAMTLDGLVIAASFDVRTPERVYGIMTVYDPEYARLAPGRLLMDSMVCQAIESGCVYDFCLGDETYKAMWAKDSEPLVTFVGRGLKGAVLKALIERRARARSKA